MSYLAPIGTYHGGDRGSVLQFDSAGNPVISRQALRRYLSEYLSHQKTAVSA